MIKSNKIVRVREINNTNEAFDRWTYDIYLTTFKEYLSQTNFICYGEVIEFYPYRWYEIERIWEIPLYLFKTKTLDNDGQERKILSNKIPLLKALIRLVTWLVSGISMFLLTEYFLRSVIKNWFHLI